MGEDQGPTVKLVNDWQQGWKWFSIHISVLISALNAAQASIPYVQQLLTPTQLAWTNAGLGILIICARLVSQGGNPT